MLLNVLVRSRLSADVVQALILGYILYFFLKSGNFRGPLFYVVLRDLWNFADMLLDRKSWFCVVVSKVLIFYSMYTWNVIGWCNFAQFFSNVMILKDQK